MGLTVEVQGTKAKIVEGERVISQMNFLPHPPPQGAYLECKLHRHYSFDALQERGIPDASAVAVPAARFAGEERKAEKEAQMQRIRALSASKAMTYDQLADIISQDLHARHPKASLLPGSCHYRESSVAALIGEFRTTQRAWQQSPHYDTFVARIRELKRSTCVPFTNVVALGTGSIHKTYRETMERWLAYARVSVKQLAAAMALQELLGELGEPLPCTVQDPVYSQMEKEALTALGFKVVDYPDDLLEINSGSVVFYLATQCSMAWEIGQGIWPAAMICNNWADRSHGNPETLPESYYAFVQFMFQFYERQPFQSVGHEKQTDPKSSVFLFKLEQKLS